MDQSENLLKEDSPLAAPAADPEPGLYANIKTWAGSIVYKLFGKVAPKTVANFRALATGSREWTDPRTGQKVKKPPSPDTVFHRVIQDS